MDAVKLAASATERWSTILSETTPRIRKETGWGYTKIIQALRRRGHTVSRQTVKNALIGAGLEPEPQDLPDSWSDFLKHHADALAEIPPLSARRWPKCGASTTRRPNASPTRRTRYSGKSPKTPAIWADSLNSPARATRDWWRPKNILTTPSGVSPKNDELVQLAGGAIDEAEIKSSLRSFDQLWDCLRPKEQSRIAELLVEQVTYDGDADKLSITYQPTGVRTLTTEFADRTEEAA